MRTCLTLDLMNDPDQMAQYERYHQPGYVWAEIPLGIREGGVIDMQICRIANQLFMILGALDKLTVTEVFRRISELFRQVKWAWATFIGRFLQRLPEAQPGEHCAEMKAVFPLTDHITV